MYSGSTPAVAARSAWPSSGAPDAAHHIRHQSLVPRAGPRAQDHRGLLHARLRGSARPRSRRARSGSPRTFTWSSARPRNSSSRRRGPPHQISGAVHALPGPPNGQATNRSAVSPGRPRYPRARPAPAMYSSPATPGGTGRAGRPARTPGCWRAACRSAGWRASAAGSGSLIVAHTVASVGPYALISRRSAAHRAASPAGTASPAKARHSRSGSLPPGTPASAVGVTIA